MNNRKSYIKVISGDYSNINEIVNELNISELMAKILINRGINSIQNCSSFIYPTLDKLYDPFMLKDMDICVERILTAISNKENIFIYGDYDVDGITSTSLLILFFRRLGIDVEYYIPNRLIEGYGLNKGAIDYILSNGGQLIITVDCGITSLEVADYCKEKKIDIIITDHHQCQDILPRAYAIINPNREDDGYSFKDLAGVGVTFKLIQAIAKKLDISLNYEDILPIVAIGTIADVVPLKDENRIIVKNGLKYMQSTTNIGIQSLLKTTDLIGKKITSGHIGFGIAPRINAVGRLDSARWAVELLTTENKEYATELANKLEDKNKERQNIEANILKEAEIKIQNEIDIGKDRVFVISGNEWHNGVIGIVSSRITEKYFRPSVIISLEEDEGRGSARSIPTFDLFQAFYKCKTLFKKFGGHKQAAGISISKKNINKFKKQVNEIADCILDDEDLVPQISVDCEVDFSEVNHDIVKQLSQLEPYGIGNPSPLFIFRDLKLISIRTVGKNGNHLKLKVGKEGIQISGIGFNLGYLINEIHLGDTLDLIGSLEINNYMGNETVQLIIKEVKKEYESIINLDRRYYNSLEKVINYQKKFGLETNKSFVDFKKPGVSRLEYTMDILKRNEKTIVLVNNYFNVKELLGRIEIEGRHFNKNICVSYNNDTSTKLNSIVINPIFKDINKYDYKNIIIYDLFFDKDILIRLYEYFDNNNVISLIKKEDIDSNNKFLKEIIPLIDELRIIYKTFKNNGIVSKININEYISYVKSNYNMRLNHIKLRLSLQILKEGNILDFKSTDNEVFYIKINKNVKSIDIKKVPVYKYLINLLIE